MKPAIFLDRDGVIIENRNQYVRSWDDVSIFPQALDALADFSDIPYHFVIVTNQSAVGRGIISTQTAIEINDQLLDKISQTGGRIDAVFMCPHAPNDHCNCRKPKPGLFHQATQALPIDLQNSIMIGDALTDIEAAQAAGINRCVIVRTGRGEAQLRLAEASTLLPFSTYNTLFDAFSNLL